VTQGTASATNPVGQSADHPPHLSLFSSPSFLGVVLRDDPSKSWRGSVFVGAFLAPDNDESLAIRMNDKSKTDNVTPISTDQSLFEISNIKARITKQILTAVKESSFDCMIHYNPESKEKLNCYSFGASAGEESLAYKPDINSEEDDTTAKLNKKDVKIAVRELVVQGKKYAVDTATNIIYDLDFYNIGNLVERGKLIIIPADPATGEGIKYNVTLL
jgi:hypothetical protein